MSPRRNILYTIIGLAWFFAIITVYYVSHKPFTIEIALALALAAWRLLAAAGLVSIAGGLGYGLLKNPGLHPLARLSLEAAMGLGMLSLSVLLVGSFLAIPRWAFWVAVLVLAVILRKRILAWWRQWRGAAGLLQGATGPDGFNRAAAVLIGSLALSALFLALAPPVKYDAMMYHLVMPDAYLRAGRVTYLPWIAMTGMPQNTEMLYAWAIALGGLETAPVLGWLAAFLALTGLVGYIAQLFGSRTAWVAAAGLLSGYTLAISMGWGYVDWLGLYFGLGTLICLDAWRQDAWRQNESPRALICAGAFAGLALGTKYPAGVLGLVGFGAVLWHVLRTRRALLPAALRFGIAGLLPPLPWLVKNFVTTGNPLYPFLMPAGAMTAVRMGVYQGMAPYGDWKDLFLLPFQATYMGIDSAAGYSVAIGPLLLGLGALAWIGWKRMDACRRAALENAAVLAVLGLLVWSLGNHISGFLIQTRFYFSLFPAFAFLCAAGFWGLQSLQVPGLRLGRVAAGCVLLVLVLNGIDVGGAVLAHGAPQAALGLETAQKYRTDNLGWFEVAIEAVNDLPAGSHVLLLYEPRSLYCQPTCLPDEILDRWKRSWTQYHDPQAIRAAWRAEGFTHVLFNRLGASFMQETKDPHVTPEEWQALDRFLASLPKPVDFGQTYELYDIRP